jgi:parallel beta-helix repeat protein
MSGVLIVSGQSAAFMSYVRFNDQHDDGQLTQFCERLSAEVRVQTGEEFLIFQDRNDIAWGQAWQQRIDETLDAVTLLVAIITPSFFRSPPCRAEVERFLKRERELGRHDLILPVYYVSTPELDDPARRGADKLAQVLASRQFADWRELRFEPFTAPVVRRTLAQLAARMRDTFWQLRPTAPANHMGKGSTARSHAEEDEPWPAVRATAKIEPPTHVVDPYQRGDFVTVTAAIAAASPGDRILVRPGLYQESLVIDKPLEVLGDGPVADIEIQGRGSTVLLFNASIGRVANLTLRKSGSKAEGYGVDIAQGRLELEGCDITSQSFACVAIHNGADPRLRRNFIHDGRKSGVHVFDDGLGTLEDNEITRNFLPGVTITRGGNPTLRRNQIHDNKQSGVFLQKDGSGTIEDNDISTNAWSGVSVKLGGNPTLRHNRINRNGYKGVWIREGGRGVFEDNDLTSNERGAWQISKDCLNSVTRARNSE